MRIVGGYWLFIEMISKWWFDLERDIITLASVEDSIIGAAEVNEFIEYIIVARISDESA